MDNWWSITVIMLLSQILYRSKIENLGYDTVFVEYPVSPIVDFDYRKILPPPPQNTSSGVVNELNIVSKATLNRTEKQINLIYSIDQELDRPFILLLKKYNLAYPQKYIDTFYDITRPILMNTKSYWNRARPIQLAKLLNIPIDTIITDTIHSASYPSGHTVYSSLVANILKDYYPQISIIEIESLVTQTAEARVAQGVHYPSDNKASIKFSNYVFQKLNPKLRKYKNEQI